MNRRVERWTIARLIGLAVVVALSGSASQAAARQGSHARLAARATGAKRAGPEGGLTRRLPLIEVPTLGRGSDTFAVFLSGDGGWGKIHKIMSAYLRRRGVPVVGWNMFRYLWHRRTPAELGRDLSDVIRTYLSKWHKQKVIVLGYSLGAEVVPFMVSRLPADLRRRVSLVAMLGPSPETTFEFHLSEWLNLAPRGHVYPVKPEIEKLKGMNVMCIYGDREKDSVCPLLDPKSVRLVSRHGGHHFGGHYRELAQLILEAAKVSGVR